MIYTYYFLENGEVIFIENFTGAEEAIEYKVKHFPNSTLALRVGGQDDMPILDLSEIT